MAKVLNDTDALTFMLTQYGLNRISDALSDPNEDINLSKIKVGDANFEYYEPTLDEFYENTSNLRHLIPNGEFYIIEKALLEDGLTISLRAVFPETLQNAEIREVGIYETVDGIDYLFAVSTQQPLLKPYIDLGYLISVDYYAFLKSQNLADVYEQIVLNPDNQLVTEEDLEKLMSTVLFTESNLMEQINGNTRIIGLNRSEQLYNRIQDDQKNFGYYSAYANFSTILNYVNSDEVFGYWIFNYPRRVTPSAAIVDVSPYGRNFSTNKNINGYSRIYNGIMPMLDFSSPDYFLLNEEMSFLNDDNTSDIPFTMGFAIEPLSADSDRTLLARSDYSSNTNIFEVNEKADNSLEIKLFTNSSIYLKFTSDSGTVPTTRHSLVFSYDATNQSVTAYANGQKLNIAKTTIGGTYTHMNNSLPTLYGFSYTPTESKYANNASNPTQLYNADGTPCPNGTNGWSILEANPQNQVIHNGEIVEYSNSTIQTVTLYAWVPTIAVVDPDIPDKIYTKSITINADTKLFNADYTEYHWSSITPYKISPSGDDTYTVTYSDSACDYTSSDNILPVTRYEFMYTEQEQVIWTNSSTTPSILYESDGSVYSGDNWTIDGTTIKYNGNTATATGQTKSATFVPATSFIIDSNGSNTNFINSNVGVITVIKNKLTENQLRNISLSLKATLGDDPCVVTY